MINKIKDGIIRAIHKEFGDKYEIYPESIEQGLQEPCFYVECLNKSNEQFLNNRYFREHFFIVQYFPESNEKNSECDDVVERLFDCLEYITVDNDLVRGTQMKAEMVDDVLHFRINFNLFVHKIEQKDNKMGSYKVERKDG